MRRYGGVRNMYIFVTSSQAGNCDLVFEYACAKGDEYVHDVARRRITSVNPPLLADYDRNGRLDQERDVPGRVPNGISQLHLW